MALKVSRFASRILAQVTMKMTLTIWHDYFLPYYMITFFLRHLNARVLKNGRKFYSLIFWTNFLKWDGYRYNWKNVFFLPKVQKNFQNLTKKFGKNWVFLRKVC